MPPPAAIDPRSGYCADTGIFHSLFVPTPLLPPNLPLSFPAFALSLLPSPLPSRPAFIDSTTGETVPFPNFFANVRALATHLRVSLFLSRGDVAFVLAPPCVHVPVLYYALMASGTVVSPANPALTVEEVASLVALSKPTVAFAVSSTAAKLPPGLNAVLLDSPRFLSFLQAPESGDGAAEGVTRQSDLTAILYSSGTTGRTKAVVLTHRNLMLLRPVPAPSPTADVLMMAVRMFHIYGFMFCLRAAISAQKLVLHTARERLLRASPTTAAPPPTHDTCGQRQKARAERGSQPASAPAGFASSALASRRWRTSLEADTAWSASRRRKRAGAGGGSRPVGFDERAAHA